MSEEETIDENTNNSLKPNENAVKVYLRIRPSCLDEQSCVNSFCIENDVDLRVDPPSDSYAYKTSQRMSTFEQTHRFKFSQIFNEMADQNMVYENSILPSVKHFLDGYNCLVFTYGVTNSGKTFTLVGDNEQPGLLHNTLSTIFATINQNSISAIPHYKPEYFNGVVHTSSTAIKEMDRMKEELLAVNKNKLMRIKENSTNNSSSTNSNTFQTSALSNKFLDNVDDNIPTTYFIYVSAAEIYNEKIFDLLNTKLINNLKPSLKKSPLSIGTDQNGFSYIKDLTFVLVKDIDEALSTLKAGTIQREVAMTNLNMQSSRSHVIYGLKLVKVHHLPNEIITKSHEMCFVDLAGSERPSKSAHSEGPRFKEASKINLSLLALGKCIEVLRQNRKTNNTTVVPFRESKLTRLLQPFFLSHSNINLFANIGTSLEAFDETLNVLRFSALTMEALTRPMTVSLMELNISNCNSILAANQDYHTMSSNELIQHIKYLRKTVEMLQSEKHVLEAKIRQECFEASSQMMKSIEAKYKKHLQSTKNNIIDLYKNKLIRLEQYYKDLMDERSIETTNDQNSLLVSLEAELQRKTEDANQLKLEYNTKLEELTNKDKTATQFHLQEINSLNSRLRQLEDVISDKQNQITTHLMKLDENSELICSLENELELVKNKLIEKMAELEAKIEDHTKLTLEISSLHGIIDENEEKLSKLDNRFITDDPIYTKLYNEMLDTKQQLVSSEHVVERYKRKIGRGDTRITLLRDDIQFKEETIRKLRLENFGLKDEISMITVRLNNNNNLFKNDTTLINKTSSTITYNELTPVKKSTPNKNLSHTAAATTTTTSNNPSSPHSYNRTTTPALTEVSIRVDSPSDKSFRRLYEEAREYAYRMEQRVRELQIDNLPSVVPSPLPPSTSPSPLKTITKTVAQTNTHTKAKTRRSIKRNISNVHDVEKNIKEKTVAIATTNESTPISNRNKVTKLTTKDTSTPTNTTNEVNPSMVFRIDSSSPQTRKQATRDYMKRLKGHEISKENDQSIVNNVKKKLNLI